ncbi:MAG: gliding motility lipoprotein GldD [Bacteroidia bacterium]
MKTKKQSFVFYILSLIFLSACEENFVPKPMGLLKVDFPTNDGYTFQDNQCPFSFNVPKYVFVVPRDSNENFCQKNIVMPFFNATLHCSYMTLNNNLSEASAQCQRLAYEHRVKANAIDEYIVHIDSNNVHGVVYKLEGNVASNFQFYLTDSTHHFFRGALYFNARPNADSLKPYLDFVVKDLEKMIESFEWK